MAALYISEYNAISNVGVALQGVSTPLSRTPTPAPQEPVIANQVVVISGSSTQSAVFNSSTTFIRVNTDAVCSIEIGTNPTATTSSKRLAANQTEFFGVYPGARLAVISNA